MTLTERAGLVAMLAVVAAGCSGEAVYQDEQTGELFGDGDLGREEGPPQEDEQGLGAVEQGVGSREVVRGYRLPHKAGTRYRVVQYPHGYRDQIWNAIDIGIPYGEPVVAMKSGTLSAIIDTFDDYPLGTICNQSSCNLKTNFVILQHDDGKETSYLHIMKGSVSALGLKVGDRVCRGQPIGRIGHNGYTFGPHVHVSAQKGGSAGDRNQAWSAMWSKPTLVIHFEELNGPAVEYATQTSQNAVACDAPPPPPPAEKGCYSGTLGREIASGECVQVSYAGCGLSRCGWYACKDGAWQCSAVSACTGAKNAHAACAPKSCQSTTLGRQVAHGECVQMSYASCGGTCQWASCNDGAWACTQVAACTGAKNPHAACGK